MNKPTRVIFRKYPEGDVVALFPDDVADFDGNITSYMHVGQHAAADLDFMMSRTEPATEVEYGPLEAELEEHCGYTLDISIMSYVSVWETGAPNHATNEVALIVSNDAEIHGRLIVEGEDFMRVLTEYRSKQFNHLSAEDLSTLDLAFLTARFKAEAEEERDEA